MLLISMYRAVSYLVPYFLPLALAAASLAALSDISQQTGIATGGAVGITCILMAIDVMRRASDSLPRRLPASHCC